MLVYWRVTAHGRIQNLNIYNINDVFFVVYIQTKKM